MILREIARPGSGIIFDYMYREVAEGDYRRYPDARKPAKHVARMGEPFIFGIEEGDAARFVGRRGLVLRSDLDYRDLERAYLIRSDGTLDGHSASYFRLVYSEVPFAKIETANLPAKKTTVAARAVSTAPAPDPSAGPGKKRPVGNRGPGRGSNAEDAVLDVVDRFVHRWDARDTEGVLALIHESGEMMYGGYDKLMAAKKDYAAVFAERRPVVGPLKLSDPEVQFDGDLAVIDYRLWIGYFELAAKFTLKKEASGWLITRFEYD